MTVVGAVSAAGDAVPPLLIVPGKRLFKEDIAALSIKGAAITGAPKGFSNQTIFRQWLGFFGQHIAGLKKPVVLIVDNSTTHIGPEAAETCVEFGILVVTLTANVAHLFQPLDVAVFKPYKDCVQDLMLERLCAINDLVLRKSKAIEIACTAYCRALVHKPASAVNGFRERGIWPMSLVALKARLNLYGSGGIKGNMGTAEWLQYRESVIEEVRNEILLLPPVAVTAKKRKRTAVDVSGRLVTKE